MTLIVGLTRMVRIAVLALLYSYSEASLLYDVSKTSVTWICIDLYFLMNSMFSSHLSTYERLTYII